jgi:AP endonuclease 2
MDIGSTSTPVEASSELPPPLDVPRRAPPRLCTRYLTHVVPSQSIRSLFANVPGHIVVRSGETRESVPDSSPAEINKKRDGTDLKQPHKKSRKMSKTVKGPSKNPPSQRSVNEFFKLQNINDTQSSSSTSTELGLDMEEVPEYYSHEMIAVSREDNEDTSDREASRSTASQQWTSIFTKKGPPLCDAHGLPCIELVTKKPGPNLGRRFWICSKPVGPGYDNGKRNNSCPSRTDLHYRTTTGN